MDNNNAFYNLGSAAALILAALLTAVIIPAETIFKNNFLVLIFRLHAGFSGVQEESLQGINLLDISILVLVGIVALTLFPDLLKA